MTASQAEGAVLERPMLELVATVVQFVPSLVAAGLVWIAVFLVVTAAWQRVRKP